MTEIRFPSGRTYEVPNIGLHGAEPKSHSKLASVLVPLTLFCRKCVAIVKWEFAGSPVRTQEEVSHIYNDICKPCEFFAKAPKHKTNYCAKCGCPLSEDTSKPTKNKIALGTEKCPIDKWV